MYAPPQLKPTPKAGAPLLKANSARFSPQPLEAVQRDRSPAPLPDFEFSRIPLFPSSNGKPEVSPEVGARIQSLRGGGRPLPPATRTYMEPRFGHDFSQVRVHTNARAAETVRAVQAKAFTVGRDVVFGAGQYAPDTQGGRRLLAHELAHVVQGASDQRITPYEDKIPKVKNPTVKTMRQFINLVIKIEKANPSLTMMQITEMIRRTKYDSTAWGQLLPEDIVEGKVTAGGKVTSKDVETLEGEFTIELPHGGLADPSHIVVAIEAAHEKEAAGWPISKMKNISQLDIASWAGDVGSAAGEWMISAYDSAGSRTKQDFMDDLAPESDLIGDIDGVAMTSKAKSAGFALDLSQPLSKNLERFYFPPNTVTKSGEKRRFHLFCSVEGFVLNPDGIHLSEGAKRSIKDRTHKFAKFYTKTDPKMLFWISTHYHSDSLFASLFCPVKKLWRKRADDWPWFADRFIDLIETNLKAEGI